PNPRTKPSQSRPYKTGADGKRHTSIKRSGTEYSGSAFYAGADDCHRHSVRTDPGTAASPLPDSRCRKKCPQAQDTAGDGSGRPYIRSISRSRLADEELPGSRNDKCWLRSGERLDVQSSTAVARVPKGFKQAKAAERVRRRSCTHVEI